MTKQNLKSGGNAAEPTGSRDKVGYRSPPRRWHFKKGQSGNPRGRPKQTQGLVEIFHAILSEKIDLSEGGRRIRVSKFEAMVRSNIINAIKGDHRAFYRILTLAQYLGLVVPPATNNQGGAILVPPTMSYAEWEKEMEKHRARMRQLRQDQSAQEATLRSAGKPK